MAMSSSPWTTPMRPRGGISPTGGSSAETDVRRRGAQEGGGHAGARHPLRPRPARCAASRPEPGCRGAPSAQGPGQGPRPGPGRDVRALRRRRHCGRDHARGPPYRCGHQHGRHAPVQGSEFLPVAREGLDRPFMLMGKAKSDPREQPSWRSFWDRSTGWKRDLSLERAATSVTPMLSRLCLPWTSVWISRQNLASSTSASWTPSAVPPPSAPSSLRSSTSTCVTGPRTLLNGPSSAHPEVRFID